MDKIKIDKKKRYSKTGFKILMPEHTALLIARDVTQYAAEHRDNQVVVHNIRIGDLLFERALAGYLKVHNVQLQHKIRVQSMDAGFLSCLLCHYFAGTLNQMNLHFRGDFAPMNNEIEPDIESVILKLLSIATMKTPKTQVFYGAKVRSIVHTKMDSSKKDALKHSKGIIQTHLEYSCVCDRLTELIKKSRDADIRISTGYKLTLSYYNDYLMNKDRRIQWNNPNPDEQDIVGFQKQVMTEFADKARLMYYCVKKPVPDLEENLWSKERVNNYFFVFAKVPSYFHVYKNQTQPGEKVLISRFVNEDKLIKKKKSVVPSRTKKGNVPQLCVSSKAIRIIMSDQSYVTIRLMTQEETDEWVRRHSQPGYGDTLWTLSDKAYLFAPPKNQGTVNFMTYIRDPVSGEHVAESS